MTLRLPDSGAETDAQGRRHTPSAQRNAAAILAALRPHMPAGRLLEIASGSGYHAAQIAPAFPATLWQPTDINPANLTSITAWTHAFPSILPPQILDATRPGWHARFPAQNAILLVNLLHLLPSATTLLHEISLALAPGGVAFLYGPFLRDGQPTSPGDAAFHASLQAQDPSIGYKDLGQITAALSGHGLTIDVEPMPANNLMLIARKSYS